MRVQFKVPRSIGGVDYSKGIHEVPDEMSKHWYFLAQVQNGNAMILGKEAKASAPKAPAAPQKPVTPPPAGNYHDHMKQWESTEDKKKAEKEAKKAADKAKQAEARAKLKAEKKAGAPGQ